MTDPSLEARLTALEARVEMIGTEAAVARHLAVAHDRDISDLGVKVNALVTTVNGLGVQTANGFAEVHREMRAGFERLDRVDNELRSEIRSLRAEMHDGFAGLRARLDQAAGGMDRIVALLSDPTNKDDNK